MISRAWRGYATRSAMAVFWLVMVLSFPASAEVFLGRIGSQPLGDAEEGFWFEVVVDQAYIPGTDLQSASFRLLPDGDSIPLEPFEGASCKAPNCFGYLSGPYATAEARDGVWPDGTYQIEIVLDGESATADILLSSESVPNPDASCQILYPEENPSVLPENRVFFTFASGCQNCGAFEAEVAQEMSMDQWQILFQDSLIAPVETWAPPAPLDLEQEVPYRFSVYALNEESGDLVFSPEWEEVPYQVYSHRSSDVLFTLPEPSLALLQAAAVGLVAWLARVGGAQGRQAARREFRGLWPRLLGVCGSLRSLRS